MKNNVQRRRPAWIFFALAIFLWPADIEAATLDVHLSGKAEGAEIVSEAAPKFPYPPIHLAIPEASLTSPLLATKNELVDSAQVFEEALHKTGAVYDAPELQKVMDGLIPIDQLGEEAGGFHYRIYILKDPSVNAMTTPTGSIYINTGLLAAIENFDQLRLALGHEVHHIIDQDIVYKYQKLKNEVGAIRVMQLIATPLVAVAIGESDSDTGRVIADVYTSANIAVSISYQLAFMGYGREEENQCDLFAIKIFSKNHYNLDDARRVFVLFEDEHEKYGKGFQSHYFDDHESGKQRAERVEKFMKEVGHDPSAALQPSAPDRRYQELTHELRIENAKLNLKVRRPHHAREDLEELGAAFPADARIPCLLGQAYGMMSSDPKILKEEVSFDLWKKMNIKDEKKQKILWLERAEQYFAKATELDPAYAEPYRELGLVQEAHEKYEPAAQNLEKYLNLNPQAKDTRYVKSKVLKIKDRLKEIQEAVEAKNKKRKK